jgi:CHAD domain-containing protein
MSAGDVPAQKWIEAAPADPTIEVVERALRTRLDAVLYYLPLAAERADEDVEYVHELRVWTRRAGAALRLCRDLLPCRRLCWINKQLKRIRRAANEARNLDVLIQRLEGVRRPSPVQMRRLEASRAERIEAQATLVSVYHRLQRDDRFARRVRGLIARVHPPGRRSPDSRFGAWARNQLHVLVEQFFAAVPADQTDEEALHQFRVRGKELRYALEILVGACPAVARDKLYPAIADIQDRLGAINDLATSAEDLRRRIEAAGDEAEARALRRLLRSEDARLREARGEFWQACSPARLSRLHRDFRTALSALVGAHQRRVHQVLG